MAGRGFGGGRRGGRGRGRGQRPWVKELPFETFPEIEGLVPVNTSIDEETFRGEVRKYSQFANWSQNLQNFSETSPYYYEDSSRRHEKVQKVDIERYSDRKLQATKVKPPLWHFIKMDKDHMPEEIAKGAKHIAKKVRWDIDLSKLDRFEKLEQKNEGKEEEEKKEGEEDEEEEENDEDDGEFSDEGDYEQGEDFDDDEDDFNMEEDNDEPEY